MPHSSGGGSHGGGSHGGHSSHGSGGSGSSRHTRSAYFPGSTRYVYYKNKQPVFVYADYDIRQKRSPLRFLLLLFYLPFILAMVFGVGPNTINIPTKLKTDYDTEIIIDDRTGVIRNEKNLRQACEDFLDQTGIAPAVITVNNEDWKSHYVNLETYAYELYVNSFDDEKHWLIVYSSPKDAEGSFNDWYWEGMQGDDTDKILTLKNTNKFNQMVQKCLLQSDKYTPDEAVIKGFNEITPSLMKVSVNFGQLFIIIFVMGFLGVHAFFMVFYRSKDSKFYENAIPCNEEVVKQEKCDYCGGIYIVGHHLSCPHCQAPVRAHDYTVDDEGRITGILN